MERGGIPQPPDAHSRNAPARCAHPQHLPPRLSGGDPGGQGRGTAGGHDPSQLPAPMRQRPFLPPRPGMRGLPGTRPLEGGGARLLPGKPGRKRRGGGDADSAPFHRHLEPGRPLHHPHGVHAAEVHPGGFPAGEAGGEAQLHSSGPWDGRRGGRVRALRREAFTGEGNGDAPQGLGAAGREGTPQDRWRRPFGRGRASSGPTDSRDGMAGPQNPGGGLRPDGGCGVLGLPVGMLRGVSAGDRRGFRQGIARRGDGPWLPGQHH